MLRKRAIGQGSARSGQEVADIRVLKIVGFPDSGVCGNLTKASLLSSQRDATSSPNRYHSPDRPAYSPSGPMTVFRRSDAQNGSDIGYQGDLGIDGRIIRINSDVTSKTTIGLRLCKRHQSSLRQWQYSVWQVALKAIRSAPSLAQALALWPQNCLVRTAQVRWQLAHSLALCVEKQAYQPASKLNTRAHNGRLLTTNRRQGFALAAVLRFGD